MTVLHSRRRSALALRNRRPTPTDSTNEQLCSAIHQGKFIPVIGDTIRIEHIFDVNMEQTISSGLHDTTAYTETEEVVCPEALNVIECLAYLWADQIGYPLTDGHKIARVAQFQVLEQRNATAAKEDYLSFLKQLLLDVAAGDPEIADDPEGAELIARLSREHTLSFADIVDELDYPRLPGNNKDLLRTLARLPIKIYLTTSYFDFVERALLSEGKKPRSRLCFWNIQPENVLPEHRSDPTYEPDVSNPVVYHLLGMEQYPSSLVLSEDDYLDFLWQMARDLPGDSGVRIIPPYLEAELKASSLLLMGYRLQDWDFRVLFRALLNANREAISQRGVSVAIQIDPHEQPLVEDQERAKEYLTRYFGEAKFLVQWGNSDDFVVELWSAWQRWINQGGTE